MPRGTAARAPLVLPPTEISVGVCRVSDCIGNGDQQVTQSHSPRNAPSRVSPGPSPVSPSIARAGERASRCRIIFTARRSGGAAGGALTTQAQAWLWAASTATMTTARRSRSRRTADAGPVAAAARGRRLLLVVLLLVLATIMMIHRRQSTCLLGLVG